MALDISLISDNQAEAGVIATLIRHPSFINNIDYIKPGYFYNVENGCLYWCIEKLVQSGVENIDAFNLSSAINSNQAIKKKISEFNITDIQEYINLSQYTARDTLEEYKLLVDSVVTKAFKRDLFKCGGEIQQSCFNEDCGLAELNNIVNDKITGLSNKYIIGGESMKFGNKVRDIWGEICQERNDDGTYGIPSKIGVFNDYFTFSPGELILLTARMKRGKSAYFMNECIHKAIYNNIPTLMIDTEMSDKLFTKRMIASISGVELKRVENGKYNSEEAAKIEEAIELIENAPFVHEYMPDGYNPTKIESLCRHWKYKMDLQFFVYDYMKYDDTLSASEISNILGKMCDFLKNKIAGKLNIAVLSGAQLNRQNEVGSSDKIEMYCSTSIRWREKTAEEVARDGLECGNYCASIVLNRNGPQTDEGEYLDIMFDGNRMRIKGAKQHNGNNPFSI